MFKYKCVLFAFIIMSATVFGQGEAALPFLAMQKSPLLNGAGEIGAAIPITTADGFYLNPAQLGNFSKVNNFSVFFNPKGTKWMPNSNNDVTMNAFSIAAGYNFSSGNKKLPLSVGIGYYKSNFDYKEIWGGEDKFDCFSVGIGYEYYLNFNAGLSVKSFNSKINDYSASVARKMIEASGNAIDLGVMITAPVSKLAFDNCKLKIGEKIELKPNVNVTLGYAASNIGDKIYYIDQSQKDALPRSARLGFTIDISIDSKIYETTIKALGYSFTAEASDLLVDSKTSNGVFTQEYQGPFGDIQIGKNLLGLNGDSKVTVHKGHIFNLLETLRITFGIYNGVEFRAPESNSFGISSDGLFKLLNNYVDNKVVNYVTSHFSVEYTNANIFADTFFETNLKGLVVSYRGLIL